MRAFVPTCVCHKEFPMLSASADIDAMTDDAAPFPSPAKTASVCVIIPTFRRPEGLARAVNSVLAQTGLSGYRVSLLVCDNSPEGSAYTTFDSLKGRADLSLRYIHEPNTGLANARNAAVAAARGTDFIAFLDDDEEARPDWLAELLKAQKALNADVVFGPVDARLPQSVKRNADYFTHFFSRFGPAETQVLKSFYGCGNSLLRGCIVAVDQPFDVGHNQMGGEDDMLFSRLLVEGATLAWSAQARVYEDVPVARARLRYTLRRGFAFGQGPSQAAAANKQWIECAYWMVRGLAQGALLTLPALALWVIRHEKAAFMLDKAARGWGKFVWFPPFKLHFYGASMLKKKPA